MIPSVQPVSVQPSRSQAIATLQPSSSEPFEVLVIGGGATGLGIAVDAATRGFRTLLVEAGDFAQATSSRATKLVHGGVRYLATGQIHLVREALHERKVMMRNAPHLVHPQPFLLPVYKRWELPYYGAGLTLYDLISGSSSMGSTRILRSKAAIQQVPNLAPNQLQGSILYYDGQFNDARFALALARSAIDHGATVVNYMRCSSFLHTNGRISGAVLSDVLTGNELTVSARVIINATGIFTDETRRLDQPNAPAILSVSRGTHIVVPGHVLGGTAGIMIPKTRDGRVIFAIPWQGRVVIGTTDIPSSTPAMEPGHTPDEIAFLLQTINPYLAVPVHESDILSVFSGLRPLVNGNAATTARLSREHHIEISTAGLISIAGGKWTTYRTMAQDTLTFAAKHGLLESRPCITATLPLRGHTLSPVSDDPYLAEYGSDAPHLQSLIAEQPSLAQTIDAELPYTFAQCLYAVREEMAYTLEDVLSRRTRALLLNAQAALRSAPTVAALMAAELGLDQSWIEAQLQHFRHLVESSYALGSTR